MKTAKGMTNSDCLKDLISYLSTANGWKVFLPFAEFTK